jgi:hypothetical protein
MPHSIALVATVLAHLLYKDWAANSPLGVTKVVVIVDPTILSILFADMTFILLDLRLDDLAIDTARHGTGSR